MPQFLRKNYKTIIALLLSFVTVFADIAPLLASEINTTEIIEIQPENSILGQEIEVQYSHWANNVAQYNGWIRFTHNNMNFNTERMYVMVGGEVRVAYCLDHQLPGTSVINNAGHKHNVDVQLFDSYRTSQSHDFPSSREGINNEQLMAILSNGFPHKEIVGLNDDQAYLATRLAIAFWVNYTPALFEARNNNATGVRILEVAKELAFGANNGTPFSEELLAEVTEEEIELYRYWELPDGTIATLSDEEARETALLYRQGRKHLDSLVEEMKLENEEILKTSNLVRTPVLGDPTGPYIGGLPQQPVVWIEYLEGFGSLRIIKEDDEGKRLAGAVFEITGPDGNAIAGSPIVIPAEGVWYSPNPLPLGTYTITEIEPPEGHELANPTTQTVEVKADQSIEEATVTFINTPEAEESPTPPIPPERSSADVRIQKVDALSRENIPGALVRLRGISSHQVITGDGQIWEIDNTGINISQVLTEGATTAVPGGVTSTVTDGVWTLTGLPFGAYEVQEERAPYGYSLLPQHTSYTFWLLPPNVTIDGEVNDDDVIFDINEDGSVNSVLVTFENYPFGEILLTKIDEVTGEPLQGAHMRIVGYFPEGNNNGIPIDRTLITDENGQILFEDLPAGMYVIREVFAPPGYVLSREAISIPITWGQTATTTFGNEPKTQLEVLKVDAETGEPLAGARFRLTHPITGNTWYSETSSDGTAIFTDLESGTYTLEEVQAPEGYILDNTPRTIVLDSRTVNKIVIQNLRRPGLIVEKTDIDGKPLQGVEFNVFRAGESLPLPGSPIVTNFGGIAVLEGLEPGNYEVQEILALEGFLADNTRHLVRLEEGQTSTTLRVINHRLPNLEIRKVDSVTGDPLAGAVFRITDSAGRPVGSPNGEFTSDANGIVRLNNLQPGSYVIQEIRAPEGYVIDGTPQTIVLEVDSGVNTITFRNEPKAGLLIRKIDSVTGEALAGAIFKITDSNGRPVGDTNGEFISDENGLIFIEDLAPGTYIVQEIKAPEGYVIDGTPRTIVIETEVEVYTLTFRNEPKAGLLIRKIDSVTGEALAGAIFRITDSDGRPLGNSNGEFTSDENGLIFIENITPGTYIVQEIKAPEGYVIDGTPRTIVIETEVEMYTLTFRNEPKAGLLIRKIDSVTGEPLAGAIFRITDSEGRVVGDTNGEFISNEDGLIFIDNLAPGTYIVQEIKAPEGYVIDGTPRTIVIETEVEMYTLTFRNEPKAGLLIRKIDSVTGEPLAGAIFRITDSEGRVVGDTNGEFISDENGLIFIPNLAPGTYVVQEIQAPDGYVIDGTPQTIYIETEVEIYTLTFRNEPKAGLLIRKIDSVTGEPLAGAIFRITDSEGSVVGDTNGEFISDENGLIFIPNLAPGTYVVTEIQAPDGYVIDGTPQTIYIETEVEMYTLTFRNEPKAGLLIRKVDSVTGRPLAGAIFRITDSEGRVVGDTNGEFISDANGLIFIPNLAPGTYVVTEIQAPNGYVLNEIPQTILIETEVEMYTLTFRNDPKSGLLIEKVDSVTGRGLAGAVFTVTNSQGTVIGTQNGRFVTDRNGRIFIENLEPGTYIVTEIEAPDGYILDSTPQTIYIEASVGLYTLTFKNVPDSGLTIIKRCSDTGRTLEGAIFEIRKENGELIKRATTNENGEINLEKLEPGVYHIIEIEPPAGFQRDERVREITIRAGEREVITINNDPLAGLFIRKIDAVTGQGIFGVEFMVFDSNNQVVGVFYTDDNGIIDFSGILEPGRYTLRETRPAPGYYDDHMPRTVEFVAGRTTEIVWENVPIMGQIQVRKVSADNNEMNGLPGGTPLEGAIFELYDRRTGNIVDRFESGPNGIATSRPLPLGRYILREVQAPAFYKVNTAEVEVEIEFPTQIVRLDFSNYSANLGVHIRKTGVQESMPGNDIVYHIRALENQSTVPLNNFFWRDSLPTDAIRATKIVTGTYSHSLRYRIEGKTNTGERIVISDNLSTQQNHVIDLSNASLGLPQGVYLTEFTFLFGTVPAGFKIVEEPQIHGRVLPNLPSGYQFANRVEAGGSHGEEWQITNSTWLTTIVTTRPRLPQTGW